MVPTGVTRKVGRYEVQVFRFGRLAVSLRYQGQGLGAHLLWAAGERALAVAKQVGSVGLAIDAKDALAAAWYRRFGAVTLLDDPLKLLLPLETVEEALRTTPAGWGMREAGNEFTC